MKKEEEEINFENNGKNEESLVLNENPVIDEST